MKNLILQNFNQKNMSDSGMFFEVCCLIDKNDIKINSLI